MGGDRRWLWNIMDEGTRFQLASVISRERKIEDARKAFRMAKQIGKKKPKFVITDGLGVYHKAGIIIELQACKQCKMERAIKQQFG
ncbi:MAG: DDE-type integrase/transposase/recombinase [Methanophagales archaeon]|nr:DDE-type integrase/transposase/recombinase [Methanophagales archaeon]